MDFYGFLFNDKVHFISLFTFPLALIFYTKEQYGIWSFQNGLIVINNRNDFVTSGHGKWVLGEKRVYGNLTVFPNYYLYEVLVYYYRQLGKYL